MWQTLGDNLFIGFIIALHPRQSYELLRKTEPLYDDNKQMRAPPNSEIYSLHLSRRNLNDS